MIKNLHGKKITPKQWAVQMIIYDLETITAYYEERWPLEMDAMTEKEQKEVAKQIDKLHTRIIRMALKAGGR